MPLGNPPLPPLLDPMCMGGVLAPGLVPIPGPMGIPRGDDEYGIRGDANGGRGLPPKAGEPDTFGDEGGWDGREDGVADAIGGDAPPFGVEPDDQLADLGGGDAAPRWTGGFGV